ncbi:hypothetical protein EG359_10145 [Chryseobacterium joostei]|uniref:Nicotinic acid mononucleotide adenyltransferase n=1 Tax=Chryseobacterium joostei TaxID=112234 RepID=A0A1N7I4V9_9FLAO|nr:hypothetical protein [Chryseobacterium joostei]AZA99960.1 hypothetical protein EG359_10145 [Chryseobacterium joostei]SIS32078.1 hypothetical protein SAMN05421768_102676 [Chryseobacterium joostei]
MKKLLSGALVLLSTLCFSQNYYFNHRKESIKYTDSYGQTQYKLISDETSNYKFYFEVSTDGRATQLFTVYNNNNEAYWAAEIKKSGYKEISGIIFKQSLYYNTGSKENIYLFISQDYKKIIVMDNDGIAEYY